jgi:hypothetical protein
MGRRPRIALFAVLFGLAVAGALLIALTAERDGRERSGDVSNEAVSERPPPRPAPGLRETSGAHREDRGVGEVPAAIAVLKASRAGRAEARPIVDRFLHAYLDYELGRLTAAVRADLRATATPSFSRNLLDTPARLPLGVERPAQARIEKLEIYLAPNAPEGTVTAILERGRDRHRSTFLLRRGGAGWRIAGIP